MKKGKIPRLLIVRNGISSATDALDRISEAGVIDEAAAVRAACGKLGFQVEELSVSDVSAAMKYIREWRPDAIFNLCEGLDGKAEFEMHFAAMLELAGIPFTGANALTLGLARKKHLAKSIFKGSGIPTPDGILLYEVPQSLPGALRFPLICKPAGEDASLGILRDAVIRDLKGLKRNVARILKKYPSDGVLLEEFIDGREFSVAIISDGKRTRALSPSEIDFSALPAHADRIIGYEAKWLEDHELYKTTPSQCPADISPVLKKRLQKTALAVHDALGANSYGRVDFRMDAEDHIFVLEYNPNPDIGNRAGFAKALAAEKIDYTEFVKMALEEARKRFSRRAK